VAGGTLFVSRAVPLHSDIQHSLEGMGFKDVTVTAKEKDGLNMLIEEVKPKLLLISAKFYEAGTPYMMGELLKVHPKLNIAAVATDNYPLTLAAYFIWRGVKSYVNKWEGIEEFHKGMQAIRDGKPYKSPMLKTLMEDMRGYPDLKKHTTKRLMECLIMLCCGFKTERIGSNLHISKKTVENHLKCLYEIFHVGSREEMVAMAWRLDIVTKEDLQFYDNRVIDFPIPEWVQAKRLMDRKAKELNLIGFTA